MEEREVGGKGKVAARRRWGEKGKGRVGVGLIVAANARLLSSCSLVSCETESERGRDENGLDGPISFISYLFLYLYLNIESNTNSINFY